MSLFLAGEWVTVVMIGLALSMDAFSLGLGLGAQGLRWRDVLRLAVAISALHVILPLLSIWIGGLLQRALGTLAQQIAALIMMVLGSKMTIEALAGYGQGTAAEIKPGLWHLFLFAATVSIDALSVGFTLGTVHVPPLLAALTFGALSGSIALLGLGLGKKVNQTLGQYGQIAGGAILVMLGLKFFW
ncbi:MAG: manganese efflux pump [Firmicutes bacterium]|nr:manganese efflux pump [Bacillota bacterium]